jgi:hypothetical protein
VLSALCLVRCAWFAASQEPGLVPIGSQKAKPGLVPIGSQKANQLAPCGSSAKRRGVRLVRYGLNSFGMWIRFRPLD